MRQGAEYFGNDYNSCLLSSINLYNIVDDKFTEDAKINYVKLEELVRLGVNVLDETLDYGLDMLPLEENKQCALDWRAIGLGVFGLADLFVAMGIEYGSKEAIELTSRIFDHISLVSLDESCNLAKEKGTFGKYDWSKTKKSPLIKSLAFGHDSLYKKIMKYGLRNGSLLSVAPTGSLSLLMGGLSGGVEPLFKISYERSTHSMEKQGKKFKVFAKSVQDLLEFNSLPNDISDEEIKRKFPYIIESHQVKPINRIETQAIMQEYVDNAISSTINLPKGTKSQTVFDIYMKAWEQGLKGITVFVDDCKRGNILGVKDTKKEITYDNLLPENRRNTEEIHGTTYRMSSACAEQIYTTINKTDNGDIFEVFTNVSGGCTANVSTITRLVSAMLRSGIKVEKIIEELSTAKCPACQTLRKNGKKVSLSCGNAIADALKKAYNSKKSFTKIDSINEIEDKNHDGLMKCPECGEYAMKAEAHCATCTNCSFSLCN